MELPTTNFSLILGKIRRLGSRRPLADRILPTSHTHRYPPQTRAGLISPLVFWMLSKEPKGRGTMSLMDGHQWISINDIHWWISINEYQWIFSSLKSSCIKNERSCLQTKEIGVRRLMWHVGTEEEVGHSLFSKCLEIIILVACFLWFNVDISRYSWKCWVGLGYFGISSGFFLDLFWVSRDLKVNAAYQEFNAWLQNWTRCGKHAFLRHEQSNADTSVVFSFFSGFCI